MIQGARNFRDAYWTRGAPGRDTPPQLTKQLYHLWLVGLLLKLIGSSWDVSWHFKWLRDDLAPPHLINTAGTVIVIALTLFHTFTGYGGDRLTIRLMQVGSGIFLIALPIDVINHRVNGLDITSWSGSHALLYLGTAVMLAGAVRGWMMHYPQSTARTLGLTALWFFFLENVWFPNQHQEYGVRALQAYDNGKAEAEPILLQFAADQLGVPVGREAVVHFALPIADWVYPVWGLVAAAIVLVIARRTIAKNWAATAVAGSYVAYRCLIWPMLAGIDFPKSAVPLFLVLVGLAIDAAHVLDMPTPAKAVLGSAAVTTAGYVGIWFQQEYLWGPPISFSSAAVTAVLIAMLWTAGEMLIHRPQAQLIASRLKLG